jgi:hypothetical protein
MKIVTNPAAGKTHDMPLEYRKEYDVHEGHVLIGALAARNSDNFAINYEKYKSSNTVAVQKALFESSIQQLQELNMYKTLTQLNKEAKSATKDNKLYDNLLLTRLSKEQVVFIGGCLQTFAADVFCVVPPSGEESSANGNALHRTIETIVAYQMIEAIEAVVELPQRLQSHGSFGFSRQDAVDK